MDREKTKEKKTPEEWGKIYKEKHATYEQFTNKLHDLIQELLGKNDIEVAQIEPRTKKVQSFVDKIRKEGKDYDDPLKQITDLVGIRIIGYYREDVEKIGEIIEKEFHVDWENSIDKSRLLDPEQFGYLSVHYVMSLSPDRIKLAQWQDFAGIRAEVQVRTVLQHAWASIDHQLRYKTEKEAPRNLRRQLFRLSALLELTDLEFSNLRKRRAKIEEKYIEQLQEGKLDIALDLSSLNAYFESTKQHLRWMKVAEEVGFAKADLPEELQQDILKGVRRNLLILLQTTGVTTIEELDNALQHASKWGKDVLRRFLEAFLSIGDVPPVLPDIVVLYLLLFARKDSVDETILDILGFTTVQKGAIRGVITDNPKVG